MASKVIKDSFKTAFIRNYAAQAVAATKQHSYSLPHHQPIVSKIGNGSIVTAYENNSPISRIAIYIKSGSRYETSDNWGVSNVLRLCAGLKTDNFSAFGITRQIQQFGGTILCENGREHISYQVTCNRDDIFDAFKMVTDIAVHPNFRPWEVEANKVRLLTELDSRSPTVTLLELLHKAAFRNTGLGNSLFVPDHRIGKVTSDQLHNFLKATHTLPRMAFVGLGVSQKDLAKLAQKVAAGADAGPLTPSAYSGGEIRQETGGSLAYVALAGPGAKLGTDEALSLAVAQYVLGGPAGTKYGSSASSKLAAIIAGAGGTGTATAINTSYTDTGIFGFVLVEEAHKVADVVKALAKGIRTLKISDEDVKNAKAKAKSAILMATESGDGMLEEMGLQTLFTGGYIPPSEIIDAIDKVTTASVQSALSNATKGKPALAAVGATQNVPYIDQL